MFNLIIVLICVILVILFGKMVNVDVPQKPKVLARIGGSIDRDNFSYFYVHSHGPIILNLTSLIGDADLYISDANMYPTYQSQSYVLHSATCGEDVIEVPESLESPLAVGVYGHADSSFFVLEIYESPNSLYPYKQWVLIEREVEGKNNENDNKPTSSKPVLKKKKNKSGSIFACCLTGSALPALFVPIINSSSDCEQSSPK